MQAAARRRQAAGGRQLPLTSRIGRRGASGPPRPLADWADDHWTDPRVLWWSRLDERYLVEARPIPARRVVLLVFDHTAADALVARRVLPVIGDPVYGPDPDDVYAWQRAVERWVDALAAALAPDSQRARAGAPGHRS